MDPIRLADMSLPYTHKSPVRQKVLFGSTWVHEEPEETPQPLSRGGTWDLSGGTDTEVFFTEAQNLKSFKSHSGELKFHQDILSCLCDKRHWLSPLIDPVLPPWCIPGSVGNHCQNQPYVCCTHTQASLVQSLLLETQSHSIRDTQRKWKTNCPISVKHSVKMCDHLPRKTSRGEKEGGMCTYEWKSNGIEPEGKRTPHQGAVNKHLLLRKYSTWAQSSPCNHVLTTVGRRDAGQKGLPKVMSHSRWKLKMLALPSQVLKTSKDGETSKYFHVMATEFNRIYTFRCIQNMCLKQ